MYKNSSSPIPLSNGRSQRSGVETRKRNWASGDNQMPHPKRTLDLSGRVFSYLTVISFQGVNKYRMSMWLCRCVCGKEKVLSRNTLIIGNTKSCGCMHAVPTTTHGHKRRNPDGTRGTPTYSCWALMKHRCLNPSNKHYADYGGRGISLCERWMKFENFLSDMGKRPDGMSIDRIDNNKGYAPENCRWIPLAIQQQNKRNNRLITIGGVTHCVAEWARIKGINRKTVGTRMFRGVPEDKLFDPVS